MGTLRFVTSNPPASQRILGALRTADGAGVVRIEDRYDTDIEDLWSALTDPERLARWYGEVEGELHEGGQFRVYLQGPDIDAVGNVDVCEPPHRLLVRTRETEQSASKGGGPSFEQAVEATLSADAGQTILTIEVRGLPLAKLASYGVGWQLHAETLAGYLAGRPGPDVGTRWGELTEFYEPMAAGISSSSSG
jgi:uncharacterized protein YndB with AHSA1/START domain